MLRIRIDFYTATIVMWTCLNAMYTYTVCLVTCKFISFGWLISAQKMVEWKRRTSSTMLCPIFKLWLPCWVSRQQGFYENDILQLAPQFCITDLSPTWTTCVQDSTGVSAPRVIIPIINCVTQLYRVIISVQNDRIISNWTAPVSSSYYCEWIWFNKTNMYVGVNCM